MKRSEMRQLKIEVTNISDTSFKGKIISDTLRPNELKQLGINANESDETKPYELDVEGDFTVSFDDDIPMVELEAVYITHDDKDLEINLNHTDLDDLCQDLEQNGPVGDWHIDYYAAKADWYYETLKDN